MNYVQLAGREVKESGRYPSQHLCSASWLIQNMCVCVVGGGHNQMCNEESIFNIETF